MLDKLSSSMAKLAEQRHLRAIRDGIIATLPLIIVGSIFLIIAFPPFPADWSIAIEAKKNAATILLPYRMTMFIMTLYAVMGIGYSLARSYKLDAISGAIIATVGYLLTIVPQVVGELYATTSADGVVTIVKKGTEGAVLLQKGLGFVMPMANLGSAGLFIGMIVAILSVEVLRFTTTTGFRIRMPESVPPSVARSFEAMTPTLIVVLLMATVTYWLNIDLHAIMGDLVKPLVSASDSIYSVLIIVFLITFFWSFGIHGVSIVGSLARPIWLTLLDQNTSAYADGKILPNVAPEPFYQWFIWIGGSGATIGFAFLLAVRAKSSYGKTLGRTSLIPSLFNINEPIIFGSPIVLNPTLIPPFIIAPLVNASIAYFAVSTGLVGKITQIVPWTLPAPLGAFMATGGDYKAVILSLVLIVISVLIYYPFFVAYDKKLIAEEHTSEV